MKDNDANDQYEINENILEHVICDYNFKVIVIGDSNVGKSCLSYRAAFKRKIESSLPTIGYDYYLFNILIKDDLNEANNIFNELKEYKLPLEAKNKAIELAVWDTCGQERYRSIIHNFYHTASMAIIVYAINDKDSFKSINDWVKQVKTFSSANCKMILIGNKSDLNEDEREVSYEQGLNLALENEMSFFIETSANNGSNVREVFTYAAYLLYYEYLKSRNQETIDEGIIKELMNKNTNTGLEDSKRSCC